MLWNLNLVFSSRVLVCRNNTYSLRVKFIIKILKYNVTIRMNLNVTWI